MQRIKEIERIFCNRPLGKTTSSVVHVYGNEAHAANPPAWQNAGAYNTHQDPVGTEKIEQNYKAIPKTAIIGPQEY